MKKIALIVPKGSKYGKNIYLKDFLMKNDVVSKFYGAWETPNLSLLTIAGLIGNEYDVKFIDEDHGEEIPFDEQFDLVAITAMTQQIYRAYEICEKFREKAHVVLGGIHVTVLPEEAEKHADTIIIGEGETAWKEFIYDFERGKPKKKYIGKHMLDLKDSPVPDYSLLNKSLYSSFSVQTTRGCPRTCNYCTLPIMYGKTYRQKEAEQVVEEVKAIQRIVKDPFIFFADDNMFIDKNKSKQLMHELSKLNIVWGTQTDISVADDEELLKCIYEAGCHWMFIGFENVSEKGLNFLDAQEWKRKRLYDYELSINNIHNAGINIWGSFMFGGDHDTQDVFQDTLDFVLKNGIYSGSFTILTPLPGTQLFSQMEKQGRIIDYDWSRYTFWDVVFRPENMSDEQLAKGVAWVYDQFYSKENVKERTRKIKERLRRIKNISNK